MASMKTVGRGLVDKVTLGRDLLLGKDKSQRAPTPRELREAQMEARIERRVMKRMIGSLGRVNPEGGPNLEPLAFALREMENMRWDIKVLGSALAQHLYAAGFMGGAVPDAPSRLPLTSKICCQSDLEQPWFRYWAAQIHMAPVYHRKVWEDAFVLQALWEAGAMQPGRKGLGFAVGAEALPSYFASHGVDILATDLDATDARAREWTITAQHAASLDQLHHASLVGRAAFDRHCRYQPLDMNAIPAELFGSFDFCWSVCSFEHVGSIEKGLAFVENSLRCLKPGGTAVHTTEFNLDMSGETIDHWQTVLFQRRHFDTLSERLAVQGHTLVAVDYDAGGGALDGFVDLPPYPQGQASHMRMPGAPHLRLSVDGFPVTSIGLILRAAG